MASDESTDDFSPRDIALLQARIDYPTASSRELSEVLEREYDISLSHNRVNQILREMEGKDLFRKTIVPRRSLFRHYLFRISFFYPNFKDHWEECYEFLVDDPHVLMYFNADSKYQWQLIAQFRSNDQMEQWMQTLFEEHGEVIDEFDTTMLHNLHKFRTEATIFDDMLRETEEGREYLEHRNAVNAPDAE